MYILGLNAVFHESAAALLRDGELIAMAEEERFNRVKHGKKPRPDNPDELPIHAIQYCLDVAGIDLKQVAYVGYSSLPDQPVSDDPLARKFWTAEFTENVKRLPGRLEALGFRGEVKWIDHHTAHAASAFYASPFDEAAVFTIDGIGDGNTTVLYHGRGHRIDQLADVKVPHSIGFLWELVSLYLGFDVYDATKIMGLAAYGSPDRYADAFRQLIYPTPDGLFRTNPKLLQFHDLDYLTPGGYLLGLEQLFGMPRREPGQELSRAYQDISAALQAVTDEIVLHMVRHLHQLTGSANLCVAGGVALNCVTNQRAFDQGPFTRLFVQPAANDAGTAPGSAWYIHHHLLERPDRHPMTHPYWGPEFSDRELERALQSHLLNYTRAPVMADEVASLLDAGHIVAYFQGRMEIGPRALGNRSLLADPRKRDVREILNHKVKHREYFRPFAPSVLVEELGNWFEVGKPTSAAEYMLMAYPVRGQYRDRVPAVVHEDGTCRLQAVRSEVNPRYHAVISAFFRRTGVPMVLNTSFNDSEPIVCTPTDAIHTFLKTDIDYLVLGDFIVSKADNPDAVRWWREKNAPVLHALVDRVLARYPTTAVGAFHLLADPPLSESDDAVSPPFPEHQFLLDEVPVGKLRGAEVLTFGSNAGLFALAAGRAGAKRVTVLEGNPRARALTSFNCILNGWLGELEIWPGDDPALLAGQTFDYLLADFPFTPGAGPTRTTSVTRLGLGAAVELLPRIDELLTATGRAQVVALSPGDATGPCLLVELTRQQLPGRVVLTVNPHSESFEEYLQELEEDGVLNSAARSALVKLATAQGLTRLYLCVLNYEKGPRGVTVVTSTREYRNWLNPLPTSGSLDAED